MCKGCWIVYNTEMTRPQARPYARDCHELLKMPAFGELGTSSGPKLVHYYNRFLGRDIQIVN